FEIINILVIFQKRINSVLGEHLNKFIIVYFSDIIYLINKEEYREHILVAIKKYKFFIKKTNFIGFIIELGYISINLKKIKAIVSW
ncbi:uncharacterized protein K441DRAFT_568299, partial [Cenococcum geophilum 1.58]|uniref:uncharacterized protein n=1 Tax=Cenococcum geophilum 1.58 TaxID=794803 RepID=UPI00358EA8DB